MPAGLVAGMHRKMQRRTVGLVDSSYRNVAGSQIDGQPGLLTRANQGGPAVRSYGLSFFDVPQRRCCCVARRLALPFPLQRHYWCGNRCRASERAFAWIRWIPV